MKYPLKDFINDVIVVSALGTLVFLGYHALKPCWVRIAAGFHHGRQSVDVVAPEGATFAMDWSVQDLNGQTRLLSEFKDKVLFINFWATWCGPCRMEMATIEKLYSRFKDRDKVAFLIISNEDPEKVRAYAKKKQYTLPFYILRNYPNSVKVASLPTTYILTRDGKVALAEAGARDWNKEKIITLLEQLHAS